MSEEENFSLHPKLSSKELKIFYSLVALVWLVMAIYVGYTIRQKNHPSINIIFGCILVSLVAFVAVRIFWLTLWELPCKVAKGAPKVSRQAGVSILVQGIVTAAIGIALGFAILLAQAFAVISFGVTLAGIFQILRGLGILVFGSELWKVVVFYTLMIAVPIGLAYITLNR